MSHPQPITVKEVCDLADDWFHGVASGEPGSSIARLFRDPDARIHTPDGQAFSLEDHRLLHTKWTAEKHLLVHRSGNPETVVSLTRPGACLHRSSGRAWPWSC
jgi:hypothetical protein